MILFIEKKASLSWQLVLDFQSSHTISPMKPHTPTPMTCGRRAYINVKHLGGCWQLWPASPMALPTATRIKNSDLWVTTIQSITQLNHTQLNFPEIFVYISCGNRAKCESNTGKSLLSTHRLNIIMFLMVFSDLSCTLGAPHCATLVLTKLPLVTLVGP